MICPRCNQDDDKVIDSRSSDGGHVVRRRRECQGSSWRFPTYERAESAGRLGVDMPIATAVEAILHRGADIDDVVEAMLTRPFKAELPED